MNTSSEFIAELGTVDEFVSHLQKLTCKRLRELARRVEDVRATTAGDVEWWRPRPPCRVGFTCSIAPVQQRSWH
jgi:hypothetical protein